MRRQMQKNNSYVRLKSGLFRSSQQQLPSPRHTYTYLIQLTLSLYVSLSHTHAHMLSNRNKHKENADLNKIRMTITYRATKHSLRPFSLCPTSHAHLNTHTHSPDRLGCSSSQHSTHATHCSLVSDWSMQQGRRVLFHQETSQIISLANIIDITQSGDNMTTVFSSQGPPSSLAVHHETQG